MKKWKSLLFFFTFDKIVLTKRVYFKFILRISTNDSCILIPKKCQTRQVLIIDEKALTYINIWFNKNNLINQKLI